MKLPNLGRQLAYETLRFCEENGPTVQLSQVTKYLESNAVAKIPGIEEFRTSYEGHTDPKWLTQLKFQLIDFDKAGWFKKSFPKRGYWTITEDGIMALKKYADAESLGRAANQRYQVWLKEHSKLSTAPTQTIELPNISTLSIDEIIEEADLKIRDRIKKFDPYEFQKLVGAVLESMGYYVDYIAPKGKDGGVDLVCYQDLMGIKPPRMKVQVKHMPDNGVSRPTLSEFADQIKRDEVGIFVTSGVFTRDARQHAIAHEKHIRLIDGAEFVNLITSNYENLDQSTRDLIPLEKVFHLKV